MPPAASSKAAPSAVASQRACLRCIAKKRRCDHARPVCGSCGKLKVSCEYPPPQSRRGPVPGLSKRAEWRVQQCENALWYLLNVPGVTAAVKRAAAESSTSRRGSTGAFNSNTYGASGNGNGLARAGSSEEPDASLPSAPTSTLDREARAEWWSSHRLDSATDILDFQRACRKLAGDESVHEDEDDTPVVTEAPRADRAEPRLEPQSSTAASPAPQSSTPTQIYTPASSSLRNSMGPSLWQLVTAAIPDSDSAGFARELQELRTRRERAVTAQGDADAHAAHAQDANKPMSPHELDEEYEAELRRLRAAEAEKLASPSRREAAIATIAAAREMEERRKREEEARAEIAVFEEAIAREAREEREYEQRRIKDREERERLRAAVGAAPTPAAPAAAPEPTPEREPSEEEGERDRFPGLRMPLGVLPNEHLAWTYGTGGMPGVGGAGKRRRLEDMFW